LKKGVAFIINFLTGGLARQGWYSVSVRFAFGVSNQVPLGANPHGLREGFRSGCNIEIYQ